VKKASFLLKREQTKLGQFSPCSLTADLKVIKSWGPLVKDKKLLGDWISNIEEIVQVVEHVYCASFELLKGGGNFKNEPHLGNLRRVLISMTAELQVFKCWRLGVRACSS